MSQTSMMKSFLRGAFVGVTGDMRELERINKDIQSRDFAAEAWQSTGDALRNSMTSSRPTDSTSPQSNHR